MNLVAQERGLHQAEVRNYVAVSPSWRRFASPP
jgi:hypothetical protein